MVEDILLNLSLSIKTYIQSTSSPLEILNFFEADAWIQIVDFYFSAEMLIELINFFKSEFSLTEVYLISAGLTLKCKNGHLKIITNFEAEQTLFLNQRSGKIQILNFSDEKYKLEFGGLLEYKIEEITAFLAKLDIDYFMNRVVDVDIELIKAPLVYTFRYMKRIAYYENDDFTEEIKNLIEDNLYVENINDIEENLNGGKGVSKSQQHVCLKSPQSSNWGTSSDILNNILLEASNDSLLNDEIN